MGRVFKEADVNGDKKIGLEEAMYTLRVAAGLSTPGDLLFIDKKPWSLRQRDKIGIEEVSYILQKVSDLRGCRELRD